MTPISSRRRACPRFLRTLLCAVLSAQMALPSPALAMRPATPTQGSGLEELERSLRPAAPQPRRQFLTRLVTIFGVATFLGACDRRPQTPSPSAPPVPTPPVPPLPAPPPIPPAAVGQTVVLMDRLNTASNRDAADRMLRLVFGSAEPAQWRVTGPEAKRAIAQRLLESRPTPQRLWQRVAAAVAANNNNGHATFDADRIAQFLEALNTRPYDGMFQVWRGRTDIVVPHELVIAILLKETNRFDTRAKVRRDGHGLMQVNRTTLLDKDFWALLQRHRLVTGAFDPNLSQVEVEQLLFDPTTNVLVGALYLRELLARLVARVPDPQERVKFLLMMYNTGPGWTLGFYDDRAPGAPVGGALQTTARYRVDPVFEDVILKRIQWPPDPPPPAKGSKRRPPPKKAPRHYVPIYLLPTQTLLDGKLTRTQMPTAVYEGGVDYTRTGWATFQVLLQLTHPLTPSGAGPSTGLRTGLEEAGRGVSRRGRWRDAVVATVLGLGLFHDIGTPPLAPILSVQAQVAPAGIPQVSPTGKSHFLLGPWFVGVVNGELVREHLEDFRQPILRTAADRPLTFARIHNGQVYAVGTGGVLYRLDARGEGTLQQVLTLDDDPTGQVMPVVTDLAFSGDTAYLVVDAFSTIPREWPLGDAVRWTHAWRLEAYSMADPSRPRLLQRHDLMMTEGAAREPGIGMLELVDDRWVAVTLGAQGVRLFRASALDQAVAALPLSGVSAMQARGPLLYVVEQGTADRGSRLTAWDLTNPAAPRLVRKAMLPTAQPVRGLAIQDHILYVTAGSTLSIYREEAGTFVPQGQEDFRGEVHELTVRGNTAYVLQRFADRNAILHSVDVADPRLPVYGSQYLDLGETYRPLATSRSGQASVSTFRLGTTLLLRFYNGLDRVAEYFLPSYPNPTLKAHYTQDGRFVFLVVEMRDDPALPPGLVSHAVFVFHHATGRPWFIFDRDPESQAPIMLTPARLHGLFDNQVQLEYRPIRSDGTLGDPKTVTRPLAPPQGGLEERVVSEVVARGDQLDRTEDTAQLSLLREGLINRALWHASYNAGRQVWEQMDRALTLSPFVDVRDLFRNTLLHALENAVEAIGARDPSYWSAEIRIRAVVRGSDMWLQVIDNGIGVQDDALRRVGERGFTTKGEMRATLGGGMGLSWVLEKAQRFGGRLVVENRTDTQGAIVSVVLPLQNITRSSDSLASGLEERGTDRLADAVLAQLAETAQGPGVVVIEAKALEQRPEVEQWLTRVEGTLAQRIVVYGDPSIKQLLRTHGVTVETRGLGYLAGHLVTMDQKADLVTFVGAEADFKALQRLLPPKSMEVRHLDPSAGLEGILLAVGVPADVLRQLDLRVFEGTQTLREAA